MDHVIREIYHVIRDMDHVIRDMDYVIRDMDHVIRDMDHQTHYIISLFRIINHNISKLYFCLIWLLSLKNEKTKQIMQKCFDLGDKYRLPF